MSLSDYASLLYAAQLKCNGFRQLASDPKKNGPFRYATYEEAKEKLNPQDAKALSVMPESAAEADEGIASVNMVEPTRQSGIQIPWLYCVLPNKSSAIIRWHAEFGATSICVSEHGSVAQ